MNPNDYQKQTARTECDQKKSLYRMSDGMELPDEVDVVLIRLTHAFAGISKQGGELWKAFIKHVYYGQALDTTNIKEELGDVLWHIAQACNVLGFDLGEVMEANLRKLQTRYPERFTEDCARHENRDRDAEASAILGKSPFMREE